MKRVELIKISKSYDKKAMVISDISVNIAPGEFFVLVGPSGCGKSTMLRMIAGLEEITEGILKIGDKEANLLPPSKRDISMVFQNYALYPHLSVEENIVFGLHVKKIAKEERKKRCMDVAEMLDLTNFLKRKPRELSGGQRQRTALARAIVNQAPICLMDEPLSNLDAKLRARMRSEIRQIQRQLRMTMIYVTHDQVEAMTMADRMMILHDGKVQQIGNPMDIYNKPANLFVATFIGSPPMNISECQVNKDCREMIISSEMKMTYSLEEMEGLESGRYFIGIRPEHLKRPTLENEMKNKMNVKIINVEILGNETIFSFYVRDLVWTAKWNGQWQIQIGDVIPIVLVEESICLFDYKTQQILKTSSNLERRVLEKEVLS
ncbi:ABC transporter ATP-binding protein [Bacillus chungangensis]|uniref:ABC transporter ATP-binding protein n=1 Tax=Bacillus chungangensis TaxID=587633 RepID=UPI0027D8709F|nr:ABC transporter ATP-binding protein [Bacillus chungangensis]